MRHADNRCFLYSLKLIENLLYLLRVNIEPAADNHILGPTDNGHITVRRDTGLITGIEEAIGGEIFAGFFGHPPVTLEYIGPAHL